MAKKSLNITKFSCLKKKSKKQFAKKKKPAPCFPSDRVSEVVLASSHGGRSFLRLRYVDGRTDGRTCTRKREDGAARSLPRFALEPPLAFTFFRLGFRFPKSFSYSSAVEEEGVVVEFWRSTTTSRRRREREKKKRRSELLGFPLFSCFWSAHRLGSMSSQRSAAVARRFRKNLVSLQVLRASLRL